MTRYAKEHKQQTRQQILRAARRMLQTRGVEGTAIPALMGEAGLTHGGFYAYFRNKTDLLAEVCAGALKRRVGLLAAAAASPTPDKEMAAFIDDYLNTDHRENRATGCILPALAGEISRQEPEVRHSLSEAFKEYVARIADLMPEGSEQEREDHALALASGMAGALMMARTVDDPELSDRIIAAASDFYKASFAAELAGPSATAKGSEVLS